MISDTPRSLPRVLGAWMATALVVGTVIGSGVFKKARVVADNVPEFGLAMGVWVLGGVLTVVGALAYAEVAVRYPKAGGNYVFLREGYGRWAGFLWGWVDFGIIRSASIAVLATMAVESLHDILRQAAATPDGVPPEVVGFWGRQLLTVGAIVALTVVNVLGTRVGGGLQVFLTALKVASLVGIMALPAAVYCLAPDAPAAPSTRFMVPLWPADWWAINWGKFGVALVGVLWAYQGWMNIGPVAEEVRNPQRNIPLSALAGVLVITVTYVGANVAYYTVLSAPEMAKMANTPVATEFAARLLGPAGAMAASLVVMTSVLGSLNGNVLVGPRLLYAMAEDGLAPRGMQALSRRFRTPALAMWVCSAWSCVLVLALGALTAYRLPTLDLGGTVLDLNVPAGKSPFDVFTDYAMVGAVVFETLAVATLFRFRGLRRRAAGDPPYRCPGYPLLPALYVIVMSAVAVNMLVTEEQRSEAVIGLVYFAAGLVVYAVVSRRARSDGPV